MPASAYALVAVFTAISVVSGWIAAAQRIGLRLLQADERRAGRNGLA